MRQFALPFRSHAVKSFYESECYTHVDAHLMLPLVDDLVKAGKTLKPGECYGYVVPPALGGDYTVENTDISSLLLHYSMLGQINAKIIDLPDGTPVSFETED